MVDDRFVCCGHLGKDAEEEEERLNQSSPRNEGYTSGPTISTLLKTTRTKNQTTLENLKLCNSKMNDISRDYVNLNRP